MMFNIKNTKAWRIKPTISSRDIIWINFHKALLKDMGQSKAAIVFIKIWEKQGTSTANTYALRKYLSDYNIELQENILNKIRDLAGGVEDFFSGIYNFGKYTGIALTVIAVGGLALITYNVARAPEKFVPKR